MFIAGSGPTNRDGNSAGSKNNSLKLLATHLVENGIASFRYDKRGIGESKMPGMKEDSLRFDDFVADASAWVKLLKADKRFKKIIIAGHSEGSLIGMLAAQQAGVDGFVSLAGPGRGVDELLVEQIAAQLKSSTATKTEDIDIALRDLRSGLDTLKAGKHLKNFPLYLSGIFRPSVQPFMQSWLQYNPAIEITKLSMPVLIVNGGRDLQVGVHDATLLHQAKPMAVLSIIDNMNHVLKDAPEDRAGNLSLYNQPDAPLSPTLGPLLVNFSKGIR